MLTFGAVQVADVDEAAGPSSDTSGMGDLSGVEVIRISSKKQRQKRRNQLHALSQQKTAPPQGIRSEYWDVETSFAWDADLARLCGLAVSLSTLELRWSL